MTNVVLIRPPSLAAKWVPGVIATPPLAHAYLAGALVKHGHCVKVVDAVGEAIHQRTPVDATFAAYGLTLQQVVQSIPKDAQLIGISAMFTQEWPNVRRLATLVKAAFPHVPLVCGGEHATAEARHALTDCPVLDCVVMGEGEATLLDIAAAVGEGRSFLDAPGIAHLAHGVYQVTPRRPRIRAVDTLAWPAWDLIPLENYLKDEIGFGVRRGRSIPMLATRGCPYQCTFCSSPRMWTTKWVARDPLDVVREIESYIATYRIANVDFYDLTAIVKREWIIEFCNLLISRQVNITWQLPSGTRSEAIDAEVCQLLYRSGCRNITYAPESGSPDVLKRIKKRVELDRMLGSMDSALKSGINTKFNLIFGFPGETHREVLRTMQFIVQTGALGVHDLSIWLFSPYPGSELFEQLKAEGRIEFSDGYFASLSAYSDFSQAVSWNPNMSAQTLRAYRLAGTALFYGVSYALHPLRVLRSARNVLQGTHESRLETVLASMVQRLVTPSKAPAAQ
jgi:anaerobic magnesium-protoporphyrin IX monomethyl ester cyclase